MNLFIDSEASGNEENTLVVKKLASLIRPRYYSYLLGAGDLTVDFPPLYVFSFLICVYGAPILKFEIQILVML